MSYPLRMNENELLADVALNENRIQDACQFILLARNDYAAAGLPESEALIALAGRVMTADAQVMELNSLS